MAPHSPHSVSALILISREFKLKGYHGQARDGGWESSWL